MIVVVEGASASGKTTWCRAHYPSETVWESAPPSPPPSRLEDAEAAARFWLAENADRWSRAIEIEARRGIAVCDSDPLKLHYTWSRWQVGDCGTDEWQREAAMTRDAMVAREIGFADLVILSDVEPSELRRRKNGDPTRQRRHFELHARLAAPLRHWYQVLDDIAPGHVRFELSADGIGERPQRADRYDLTVFDRLVEAAEHLPQ